MKPTEIYTKLIELNGKPHQISVAIGEFGELINEVVKVLRNKVNNMHICEEIADSLIVLDQLHIMFDNNNKLIKAYKDQYDNDESLECHSSNYSFWLHAMILKLLSRLINVLTDSLLGLTEISEVCDAIGKLESFMPYLVHEHDASEEKVKLFKAFKVARLYEYNLKGGEK